MLNVAYRNWRETETCVPIENTPAGELELIVPNLHRRYSGVTATNRMVAPKLGHAWRGWVRIGPTASMRWDLAIWRGCGDACGL